MNKKIEIMTDVWEEYERGKNYNRMQGLYEESKKNHNFYHGNQWEGAQLGDIQPVTLNIIKSIVKYKVSTVNSNSYEPVFNPSAYDTDAERKKLQDICKMLTRYVSKVWENQQIDKKIRECVRDACIDSESILHIYEKDDEIKAEIIDKNNIYYGNENEDDIQEQPYIIIAYRRTVESVKDEARKNGVVEEEIENIVSDLDYQEQSSPNKRINEISPMCLVLLKYYKEDGKVYFKKATKNVIISNDENTDLELYPVAHLLWERVKGYARGNGEVKWLIPNQIEINKTATRRAIAVKIGAYPKLVANMKYISNPSALNKVGTTIQVDEIGADDVNKIVNYLRPTQMSSDALNLQQELQSDTQNLAGAGDTATGNVDPTKASGNAILAVQQARQQPLNEQIERYKVFIEDITRIYFDMIKKYNVKGITLIREEMEYTTNQTVEKVYKMSAKELQALKVNIKIDITPKSPFDKYAQEESIQNLFIQGKISFEEYAKVLPDDSVMPKTAIQQIVKDREKQQQVITQIQKQANALGGAMEQVMASQRGGVEDEMSQMQNGGNVSKRSEGERPDVQMQEMPNGNENE